MSNIALFYESMLRKQNKYVDSYYYQNCYLCATEIIPRVAALAFFFHGLLCWLLLGSCEGESVYAVSKTTAERTTSGCLPC